MIKRHGNKKVDELIKKYRKQYDLNESDYWWEEPFKECFEAGFKQGFSEGQQHIIDLVKLMKPSQRTEENSRGKK